MTLPKPTFPALALACACAAALAGCGRGEPEPAPPAVLDNIAAKNENAAEVAAANWSAESEAAGEAADDRIEREEAANGVE